MRKAPNLPRPVAHTLTEKRRASEKLPARPTALQQITPPSAPQAAWAEKLIKMAILWGTLFLAAQDLARRRIRFAVVYTSCFRLGAGASREANEDSDRGARRPFLVKGAVSLF
jgi:hypothetical protein